MNVVTNGDCLNHIGEIDQRSVDAIITDLPYGITRNTWDKPINLKILWEEYCRVLKPNGIVILFGSGMFTAELMMSNPKMWKYNLVWEKSTVTGFLNANKQPLRSHEDILVFYDKQPTYNPQKVEGKPNHSRGNKNPQSSNYNHYESARSDPADKMKHPRSVLRFDTVPPSFKKHPTEKPVALLEYFVKTYTNEDDLVLDSCCGCGSTLVACKQNGRNFIGMDTNQRYCDIARDRIKGVIV